MNSAKRVFVHSRLGRAIFTLALIAFPAASLTAVAGASVPAPAWTISTASTSPTNFVPGGVSDNSSLYVYTVVVTNTGSVASDPSKPIIITDFLPPALTANASGTFVTYAAFDDANNFFPCEVGPPARCTASTTVHPGEKLYMRVPVDIDVDAPPTVVNRVTVSGGGAAGASDSLQTPISLAPAAFDYHEFLGSLTGVDGAPETRAGSHPYLFRIGAQFNTRNTQAGGIPSGNPRDITGSLPAGLMLNPSATPVLCREVQLEMSLGEKSAGCPDASAVGFVQVNLTLAGFAGPSLTQPLYNMVSAQGHPATFGFNVGGLGVNVHLLGRVRSDGDYRLSSDTLDIPQVGNLSGVTIYFWGDPSDPSHDFRRGHCGVSGIGGEACPVPANATPFLTMPSGCSGPLKFEISSDSWQDYGNFISTSTQTQDAAGNPVGVSGCEKLGYAPLNETHLSTNQAETGTALDFDLDFANDGF
ncbi:MAG TPA: hypothetical protein VLK89_07225, partial [Solirubrobacterales bacterium]|nr:hypothetical protein [Solirubrobacterales bacterium]